MPYSNSKPRFNRSRNSSNPNTSGGGAGGSRGSFRPRRSSGGRSSGGSRNGGRSFAKKIDYSRYVQKANPEKLSFEVTTNFSDFNLLPEIKDIIAKRGFEKPTPIQQDAIPVALTGKDLVGIADTGTGKTGSFLIPALNQTVEALQKNKNKQTLIIAPTRELAQQIAKELNNFDTRKLRIFSGCFVGGRPIYSDIQFLKRKLNFVIGTPGRLKDLVDRRVLDLKGFSTVILDEVDRMLDMGFLPDITFLLEQMEENRQSLFYSATMNDQIKPIIQRFSHDPQIISLSSTISSKNVDQDIVKIGRGDDKSDILFDLLKDQDQKVLVFVATKRMTDQLSSYLAQQGIKSDSIHGDKTQFKRQKALERFKTGQVNTLLATDVAARGIDIDDIHLVINFDEPNTYDDYVHRIGRTGRAGKTGKAVTFVRGGW